MIGWMSWSTESAEKDGKHAESAVLFGQQAFAGNNEIFERYRAA